MPTPKTQKLTTTRNSRARRLKSSSEDRIEMRVCETRKRASYRSVAAVPAALWSMSLILIGGSDLKTFTPVSALGSTKQRSSELRLSTKYTPAAADVTKQHEPVHPRTFLNL